MFASEVITPPGRAGPPSCCPPPATRHAVGGGVERAGSSRRSASSRRACGRRRAGSRATDSGEGGAAARGGGSGEDAGTSAAGPQHPRERLRHERPKQTTRGRRGDKAAPATNRLRYNPARSGAAEVDDAEGFQGLRRCAATSWTWRVAVVVGARLRQDRDVAGRRRPDAAARPAPRRSVGFPRARFIDLSGTAVPATLAEAEAAGAPVLRYGLFINAIVNFLIVAFAIFLVLRSVRRFLRCCPRAQRPTPAIAQATCPRDVPAASDSASKAQHAVPPLRTPRSVARLALT